MKANNNIRKVNNSKENNNKDKALNRSRENSLKKDKYEKKCHEVCFKYSNEGYKNKSILSEVEISYYPQNDNLTLFEKKDRAKELLQLREIDNNISIEDVLFYDDTNEEAQKEYLKTAVNILINEKLEEKKVLLYEKIFKSCIILKENEYNNEILRLPIEHQNQVKYINYKKVLISSLKLMYIYDIEDNIEKIVESFHYKKKYDFNQGCILGENNYYFYCLIQQLCSKNLYHISKHINLYKDYIKKAREFLIREANFSNLSENKKNYFEYLINILVDGKFIQNNDEKEEVDNYLKSFNINYNSEIIDNSFDDDKNLIDNQEELKINQIEEENKEEDKSNKSDENDNIDEYLRSVNKAINKLNKIIQDNRKIKYSYGFNKGKLVVDILDNDSVGRKRFSMKKKYEYDINIFNKGILKLLKKEFSSRNYFKFESLIFRNIKYGNEEIFFKDFKQKYEDILVKILKSDASKTFFKNHYKSIYKELEYHFDKEDVIKEILNKIKFVPIFNKTEKAYTSPLEMKIYINSIPGGYNNSNIRNFERDIFQLGRLVIITIHELMGHFMRRYYSYLTNNLIKFNTFEDEKVNTKPEGGFFVEQKFLGLISRESISFNEALGLFKENFIDFPILSSEAMEINDLEKVILNNFEYFKFISDNEDDKIDMNKFHEYLIPGYDSKAKIISCGERKENLIYLY